MPHRSRRDAGYKWGVDHTSTAIADVGTSYYDASYNWYYNPVDSSSNVNLGTGASCYFTVPAGASGAAVLYLNNNSSNNDNLNFNTSNTTGWVKSASCYPTIIHAKNRMPILV